MDAFQFRRLSSAPNVGDQIAVYAAGTQNLISDLVDLDGQPLANPFVVGDADHWGFRPGVSSTVDVWWVDGGVYLARGELMESAAYLVYTHEAFVQHGTTAQEQISIAASEMHAGSLHAPADAQKNNNITKAEIEAKLIGEISSHTHAALGGGIDWANPIAVAGPTLLTIGKHHVCTGTTADYTVTLPAVSDNAGKLISVEMASALTRLVTVDGNGAETIDGKLIRKMRNGETAVLLCNGTTWTKVAGKSIPFFCSARAGSTQSIAEATTTLINIDSALTDVAGMLDSVNRRIIVKRAGDYLIRAFSNLNTASKVDGITIYPRKNGTNLDSFPAYARAGTYIGPQIVIIAAFAENDYVDFALYWDDASLSGSLSTFATAPRLMLQEIVSW